MGSRDGDSGVKTFWSWGSPHTLMNWTVIFQHLRKDMNFIFILFLNIGVTLTSFQGLCLTLHSGNFETMFRGS